MQLYTIDVIVCYGKYYRTPNDVAQPPLEKLRKERLVRIANNSTSGPVPDAKAVMHFRGCRSLFISTPADEEEEDCSLYHHENRIE